MSDTSQVVGDPAAALAVTGSGGCCGNPAQSSAMVLPDAADPVASPCCGTAADANAAGSCCGQAAKAEAVASGVGAGPAGRGHVWLVAAGRGTLSIADRR